jgi:hypothetical protein
VTPSDGKEQGTPLVVRRSSVRHVIDFACDYCRSNTDRRSRRPPRVLVQVSRYPSGRSAMRQLSRHRVRRRSEVSDVLTRRIRSAPATRFTGSSSFVRWIDVLAPLRRELLNKRVTSSVEVGVIDRQ